MKSKQNRYNYFKIHKYYRYTTEFSLINAFKFVYINFIANNLLRIFVVVAVIKIQGND